MQLKDFPIPSFDDVIYAYVNGVHVRDNQDEPWDSFEMLENILKLGGEIEVTECYLSDPFEDKDNNHSFYDIKGENLSLTLVGKFRPQQLVNLKQMIK